MKLKGEFTRPECDFFRDQCNFTQDEREVFDLRVRGESYISISMKLNMSEATVKRRIRDIKKKILRVLTVS